MSQQIPCPVCKTPIPYELNALLKGVKFTCSNCFAQIGIADESIDTANKTVKEFNDLKKNIDKKAK